MGDPIRIDGADERLGDALIAGFREAMASVGGTFAEREAEALTIANELVRRWIRDELQSVADSLDDDVMVAGRRYQRQVAGTVRYHTLCGAVAVRRSSYRQVGVHNGPTVVPLEIRAGIWENATPALAFSVTQGFAAGPLRHYEAGMVAAHRSTPSRSTLERIGKRIGGAMEAAVDDVAPWVRADEACVDGVASISFGLDRTTVPMAEPIADAPAPAPRIRRRPMPVEVTYRMAYVGTVSLHDEDGATLVTKRFAATPHEGPDVLMERVTRELLHQRARYPVPIAVIQDGAPELWNLIERVRGRSELPVAHEVIDRYHVDERLAQICELVLVHPVAARELYDAWRLQLDRSDTAIDRIVRCLDDLVWHTQFGASDDARPPPFWRRRGVRVLRDEALHGVSEHLEYLRKHRRRMRYASLRRRGIPIGSGATEGACKSVVAVRFKGSGQRWFETGLAPCLSLRALHLSERLRPCFARVAAARSACLRAA